MLYALVQGIIYCIGGGALKDVDMTLADSIYAQIHRALRIKGDNRGSSRLFSRARIARIIDAIMLGFFTYEMVPDGQGGRRRRYIGGETLGEKLTFVISKLVRGVFP